MPGARVMLAPLLLLKMGELFYKACRLLLPHAQRTQVSKRHNQSTDSITQGQHPMPGAREMLAPLLLLKMEGLSTKLVVSCCNMHSGHRSASGITRAQTLSPKVGTPCLASV